MVQLGRLNKPLALVAILAAGMLLAIARGSTTPNAAADDKALSLERLNFKVNFHVQSFLNGQPVALADVSESYHSSLATGLIKQLVRRRRRRPRRPAGNNNTSSGRLGHLERTFFYDTQTRRLIEFYRNNRATPALLLNQDEAFSLYENGGSTNYARHLDASESNATSSAAWRHHSVRLMRPGGELDSLLLLLANFKRAPPQLDLAEFVGGACRERIARKLHYINGLARLLLLLECRRADFKYQFSQATSGGGGKQTRGMMRRVYAAKKLARTAQAGAPPSTADIQELEVAATIAAGSSELPADWLPKGSRPLSVALNFALGQDQAMLLINVFQFELLAPDAHLSESASALGHSSYLLPLNQVELNHLLASARDAQLADFQLKSAAGLAGRQFSFRATLTQSTSGSGGQFKRASWNSNEPIELVVLFDGFASVMGVQMEFVDKAELAGGAGAGWRRNAMRTLYDGQAGLKYHVMRANFNYNNRDELGETRRMDLNDDDEEATEDGGDGDFKWRTCATDTLEHDELELFASGGGDGHLFSAAGASFMGMALVRGAPCFVFERRLAKLPNFLGLGANDYVHLKSMAVSEIYAQLYVLASDGGESLNNLNGQLETGAAKLMRLDVRVQSRLDELERLSFRLELHSFDWSTHLLADVPQLLEAGRECLARDFRLRHLDLELWFEAKAAAAGAGEALRQLQWDRRQLETRTAEMLAQAYDMNLAQQVDLEAQLSLQVDQRQQRVQLYAKLSLYEEPSESLYEQFIGYALDASLDGASNNAAPSTGARAYSYDECRWRAAHSLIPGQLATTSFWPAPASAPGATTQRLFLFCPRSSLCVLGDASWARGARGPARKLELEGLVRFPYPTNENFPVDWERRCLISALEVRARRSGSLVSLARERRRQFATGGQPQLDWLRAQETDDFERLRQAAPQLELATGGGALSLELKRVKLARRLYGSSAAAAARNDADSNSDDDESDSLLVRPLHGLAYTAAAAAADANFGLARDDESFSPAGPFASLAECARLCALHHACQSYSACHQAGGKLACEFTQLAWRRRADFEQLRAMARTSGADGGSLVLMNVTKTTTTSSERVQVQLKRSKLCSLHARPQLELFQPARSMLAVRPAIKFRLPARSLAQCARLCQERAELVRELVAANEQLELQLEGQLGAAHQAECRASWPAQVLAKYRDLPCASFHFSSAHAACELQPLKNHWALVELEHLLDAVGAASAREPPRWLDARRNDNTTAAPQAYATLNRWRKRLAAPQTSAWLRRAEAASFGEPAHYELNYEQIFAAQENRRLALKAGGGASGGARLQLALALAMPVAECARRCVTLLGCRSFDVQLTPGARPTRAASARQCQLNVISIGDLSSSPASATSAAWSALFEVARGAEERLEGGGGGAQWWHFEPSELALFMLLEPHEKEAVAAAAAA